MALNTKLGDPNQDSYVTVDQANTYFLSRVDTAEWDSIDTVATKEAVLREATRYLEWFNYNKGKYYESQSLSFPLSDHEVITGNCATPATLNSFRNDSLRSDTYAAIPGNYFKYGSVHITNGTPLYDIRLVATSNVVTGSIVTFEDFSATCTATTEFILFAPIYEAVKQAQLEQAIYLLQTQTSMKEIRLFADMGVKYAKIGDAAVSYHEKMSGRIFMSPIAKRLLSSFITKNFVVKRA